MVAISDISSKAVNDGTFEEDFGDLGLSALQVSWSLCHCDLHCHRGATPHVVLPHFPIIVLYFPIILGPNIMGLMILWPFPINSIQGGEFGQAGRWPSPP